MHPILQYEMAPQPAKVSTDNGDGVVGKVLDYAHGSISHHNEHIANSATSNTSEHKTDTLFAPFFHNAL